MRTKERRGWWIQEDWLAVWIGGALLTSALVAVLAFASHQSLSDNPVEPILSPLRRYLAEPAKWRINPLDALVPTSQQSLAPGFLGVGTLCAAVFGVGVWLMGQPVGRFLLAFLPLFMLAAAALIVAAQEDVRHWNLEYALWALAIGLVISNTVGTPTFMKSALRTELYIKTGLVLLGAGVLFNKILQLGPPGVFVSWVVTPIVLVTTYWFGQRVLGIGSRSLNMVISADMSVCGVSAAIATAAACRAKKEELSLAIGISLAFTVIMMVVMPMVVVTTGMNEVVGGAWIGGTIDSSGAVLAAGEMVGEVAGLTAITIKMIQNVLIGVVAFGVAWYWVRYVERGEDAQRPDAWEIWRRFPKFVIGFLAASAVFSWVAMFYPRGDEVVQAVLKGGPRLNHGIDTMRTWIFSLAFVSIGLESDFRELAKYLRGGKPLALYVCGQTFNLCLTLLMAWLMFQVVYWEVTTRLLAK